ncbi:MAG TPA: hypothetical protein VF285_08105 [Castellaniella sp.]|uniref:hypothetical protein n=1 Tax=Castellaniella sp. TaxID=1955812 RepID=UPI002F09F191
MQTRTFEFSDYARLVRIRAFMRPTLCLKEDTTNQITAKTRIAMQILVRGLA